jgi:hypothetical protein
MLRFFLIELSLAQVASLPATEGQDFAAFEEGNAPSIPPQDTGSAKLSLSVELLPDITVGTLDSGTTGLFALTPTGPGLTLTFDPKTLDILFLQVPDPAIKGMKDSYDTIGFTVKQTAEMNMPPLLEFAIKMTATTTEGETEAREICFKDNMNNVLNAVGEDFSNIRDGSLSPDMIAPNMPPQRRLQGPAAPPATPACVDDPMWKDSYGDSCSWYATNDPGCTLYAPAPSYGQFDNCKATCNVCPGGGPDSFCPPNPVMERLSDENYKIHQCVPAGEGVEVYGPSEEGSDLTFKLHKVTSMDATVYQGTTDGVMSASFSLTGPDSPGFELKGEVSLTEIKQPQATMPIVMPQCEHWLTVAMVVPSLGSLEAEVQGNRYCDFTSPDVEPCCKQTDYTAQDACLAAKGTSGHQCHYMDPSTETCCQLTTFEEQDQCLSDKGVQRRLKDEVDKKIALETLKALHHAQHSGQKLFQQYKDEKARLVRRALIEYAVVAVLAIIFTAGAWRYLPSIRKHYAVAPTDEAGMVEDGLRTESTE